MKHPKGLYLLFATEMAERFSYFGMRAILTLYMVSALFTMKDASQIYGSFTGLVYLTPLIGGYLSDHYLGNRRSIITGGLVMALGQFMMFLSACTVNQSIYFPDGAIDSTVSNLPSIAWMFGGLTCLIIGNGFFKPNIASMVGDLYTQDDKRKDSAFTIFYMGVNIGAFFAPLACGLFEGDFSNPGRFKWGFLIACIAILCSVFTFWLLKDKLLVTPEGVAVGEKPERKETGKESSHQPLTKREWAHIGVILIVALFVIFFWAAYEQAGVSLTYFVKEQTNRNVMGHEIPTSWFQCLPAIFCVALAPVMAGLWSLLDRLKIELASVQKQALGLAFLSIAYLVIAFGVKDIDPNVKVSMMWITGFYFIYELGELSLSPIGLSLVSKLSPRRFASLMMGIWYMSTAVSNFLAGKLATLYPDGTTKHLFGYEVTTLNDFFMIFVVMSAVASVLLFAISPLLKKMMK